jgi:intermediate filament protein if
MELERQTTSDVIRQLRGELDSMLGELHVLMDAKLTLELEISCYRKLLEGEEKR